ncbi:MAG: LamG-like jellyroll fold domain-containing protein [Nanoarchaeota archaeon]
MVKKRGRSYYQYYVVFSLVILFFLTASLFLSDNNSFELKTSTMNFDPLVNGNSLTSAAVAEETAQQGFFSTLFNTIISFFTGAPKEEMTIAAIPTEEPISIQASCSSWPCSCGDTITGSITMIGGVLTCPGTGLIVGANNIVIDCNNLGITYSTEGGISNYGIDNTGGYDNVTIKNCNIIEDNQSGIASSAIYYNNGADDGTIENNVITTVGNVSYGIFIQNSLNCNLTGNTLKASGHQSNGIFLSNSNSSTLMNNEINTSGQFPNELVVAAAIKISANSVTIANNIINANRAPDGWGIWLNSGSNNNATNNTINTYGCGNGGGVGIYASGNLLAITDNKINTSDSDSDGISLTSSSSSDISSNTIFTFGTDEAGISISTGSNSNILTSNTISTNGSGAYGLYLTDSAGNTLTNNNVTVIESYEIYDAAGNTNNLIYDFSDAKINWSKTNLTTNISLIPGTTIYLSNNLVGLIDDPQALNLNSSAKIELRNLGFVSTPYLQKNGVRCDDTDNCNITDYSGGILYADVSSFSNYSTPSNNPPAIDSLILNTTNTSLNDTNQNLTAYATTSDADGDSVKVIYNWIKNGTSIALLNMPFEGINSTTTDNAWDYSGYGNNGSENGATWNSTGGYDGKGAYEFDGNDYLAFDGITTTNEVTYSLWIKPSGSGWRNFLSNNGGDHWFVDPTNKIERYSAIIESTSTLTNDVWYHVAFTYNGSHSTLYINGSQEVQNTNDGRVPTNINYMGYDTSAIEHFIGSIDDVLIFNRSLSAEQILALYNNRTDLIVSQETNIGENWTVKATPNDGVQDGAMSTSNSVIIRYIDNIAPSITVQSPTNNSQKLSVVNLTFSVSDDIGVDQCWYSLDGGANTTLSGCANTSITPGGGIHNITFYVNDTSNNLNSSGLINFSVNYLPTINSLILNSTNPATNDTNQNLTVYNTTSDADGDSVKVIYNWYVNGISQLLFNVPFEASLDSFNATDYSGLGINPTAILGSPYFNSTGGHDGKGAYQFNGNQEGISFDASNFPAIGTGNYTIEAWVKTNDSATTWQTIWNMKSAGGTILLGFYVYNVPGYSQLAVIIDGTARSYGINNNLSDNNWHHAAFVREGNGTSQLKFYVDGVYYGSNADSFSQPAPASVYVGWDNAVYGGSYIYDFNGTIDEVRLWNKALSAEQILAIYDNRTDLIVSNETKAGDSWMVQGKSNDGKEDGNAFTSNNVIIQAVTTPSNANLTINDSAEGSSVNTNTAVEFYAYYINASSGAAITDSFGQCNITIPDASVTNTAMSYDGTDVRWEYNLTAGFSSAGTKSWSVNCTSSTYDNLNSSNTVSITSSGAVPEFGDYAILFILITVIGGFFIMHRKEEN